MNQKAWWIGIVAGGVLLSAGFGTLIYFEAQKIERSREEVAVLHGDIGAARSLIEGTPNLEREVIVLREVSTVIDEILPDTDDINNLVRTLQTFSEESGVRISGLKKRDSRDVKQGAFDRVMYTLSLESDAFEYMEFLNLLETHSRFMRVSNFKIAAASRTQVEKDGVPSHQITVDVETYVYEPQEGNKPVRVEGYDRKRDLLMGEINRRRQDLTVASFRYRGPRGRRDPWIDPRIPVVADGDSALTVQEQMDIVQEFYDRTQEVLGKWDEVKVSENVIAEMMARSELETLLSRLEDDVRRVEADKSIRYVPSERRLQLEVVEVIADLRTSLTTSEAGRGPSEDTLRQVLESMVSHQDDGEYDLMLDAFNVVETRLEYVESDPLRRPLVDRLRQLAWEAETVQAFDEFQIDIIGFTIIEDRPPAVLINGKSLGVGDVFNDELIIHAIHPEQVEFIFRGVILARRF